MDARKTIFLFFAFALTGCAMPGNNDSETDFPRFHNKTSSARALDKEYPKPLVLDVADRLPMPDPFYTLTSNNTEPVYSFTIANMDIRQSLLMFARANNINMVVDNDVLGLLDVEFHNLSLEQAIQLMLASSDFYWVLDNGIIRVRSQETRQFSVDYLRLIRSGDGISSATFRPGGSISSASSEGGTGDNGSVSISHTDEVNFWEELETQLNALASPTGKVVINRLSGTISVTDQHAYVNKIAEYINNIQQAIHRQVDIQVSIIEVSFDNNSALGVNWSRIADVVNPSNAVNLNVSGQVITPAGGVESTAEVISLTFQDVDSSAQVSALVSALDEQGDVQVVSQPHIRTINNQASFIKVGTDRTFFRKEQSTDSTSAGSTTTSSDIPQVVNEGIILSITPQISSNGNILVNISPVVTRVSSVSTVKNSNGLIQSSAPNLDVSQVTSLVRARSGETVVIGGIIQSQESRTERNVPGTRWMGPIKNIAGGSYTSLVKKELIMVLTPVVVNSN